MCDSLLAEVQTGATVDLTPILPKPDPVPLARSFSRDAPLPLQEAEEVQLSLERMPSLNCFRCHLEVLTIMVHLGPRQLLQKH